MKNLPKISIVTPSYNQGEFLEKTICSILDQNYPNLEYVIIDGGSTDGSKKIIKKYEKYLAHWESVADRGQSHAINKGFARTNGQVMAWLNSDDILRPGALQLVGSIFAQLKEVSWLTSLPSTINDQGYQLYLAQPPFYIQSFIKRGWYTRKFMGFVMQEGIFGVVRFGIKQVEVWRRFLIRWISSCGNLLQSMKDFIVLRPVWLLIV